MALQARVALRNSDRKGQILLYPEIKVETAESRQLSFLHNLPPILARHGIHWS